MFHVNYFKFAKARAVLNVPVDGCTTGWKTGTSNFTVGPFGFSGKFDGIDRTNRNIAPWYGPWRKNNTPNHSKIS